MKHFFWLLPAIFLCFDAAALAQSAHPRIYGREWARTHRSVNGRCNGMSYGTGARSCGTATGGPVGGLSSKN